VRRQVLDIVDATLASLPRDANKDIIDKAEAYWLGATRLEALLGLGRIAELEAAKPGLYASAPEPWMKDSTETQLTALKDLL
jgi:hypothetical protein